MKKICLVDIDMSVTGGVEQVTASLANGLCDIYEVFVYEIKHGNSYVYEFDQRVRFVPGIKGAQRLRQMFAGTFKPFIRFVKENKIDVVLMMGNYPALLVSAARFFTKARFVYCDHGGLMNEWHLKDITLIRFWNAKISHKIVILTEKTKKDYIEKFHIKQSKIRCIYNWIEDQVVQEARPYDVESRKILTVGRFSREKGYDMLVEVAKKVLYSHPDWEWHIYGNGQTFDEIAQKVVEYNLQKQLILKGNVDKVYRYYSQYAFLVLTSYREGLPLVLLEAAAMGLPMVSFDIETGPNEIIVQGENGYLVKPYELDEMAERIIELMENADKREKMSEYIEIKEKFEKKNIKKQWIQLIEDLQ